MKPEQITAWALDEASAEERQQLEAALLENPNDQQKADETKAFCNFLLSELRDDSMALTDKQRERLVAQASGAAAVKPASRVPSVNGVHAPRPVARTAQTRWRIGVVVRLSLAACAVLGGFWTWQTYSARQDAMRAVAHVAEKPGVKVQLAQKPETKRKAGQGPESRLLADTPVKAAVAQEQPKGKLPPLTPVPAAAPAPSALALKKTQSVMSTGDVTKLKQLQDQNAYALNFGDRMNSASPLPSAPPAPGAVAATPAPVSFVTSAPVTTFYAAASFGGSDSISSLTYSLVGDVSIWDLNGPINLAGVSDASARLAQIDGFINFLIRHSTDEITLRFALAPSPYTFTRPVISPQKTGLASCLLSKGQVSEFLGVDGRPLTAHMHPNVTLTSDERSKDDSPKSHRHWVTIGEPSGWSHPSMMLGGSVLLRNMFGDCPSVALVLKAAHGGTGSLVVRAGAPLMMPEILNARPAPRFIAGSMTLGIDASLGTAGNFGMPEQVHLNRRSNSPGTVSFATNTSAGEPPRPGTTPLMAPPLAALPLVGALFKTKSDQPLPRKPVGLASAPTIITKSGTIATIPVTREFAYPVKTPFAITKTGAGSGIMAGWATTASDLSPEGTEFDGFVNYGSPVSPSAPDAAGLGGKAAIAGAATVVFANSGAVAPASGTSHSSYFKLNGFDDPAVPSTPGSPAVANPMVRSDANAAGNLVKAGSGTLVVSGANTYAGTTVVSGGTLLLVDNVSPNAPGIGTHTAAPLLALGSSSGTTKIPTTAGSATAVHSTSGTTLDMNGAATGLPALTGATTGAVTTTVINGGTVALGSSAPTLQTRTFVTAGGLPASAAPTSPIMLSAASAIATRELEEIGSLKGTPSTTTASSAAGTGDSMLTTDAKTDAFYFGRRDRLQDYTASGVIEESRTERRTATTGESYTRIIENEMKDVAREPLSTLSIDVDTASYANVRRFLNQNMIPPPDAVRIEELVNYFPTAEEGPAHEAKEPFAVRVELAPCPWQPVHRLARIAIKGREMDKDRKASNLVFLIDVSGSMNDPAKLPLVQQSLRMLTEQLGEGDRVTIVVYAGSSGVVLPPTNGEKKSEILAAIDRLSAGGSTHGSAGIKLAYEQAVAGFIKGGVNRVILCTDGDFNVGVSSPEELEKLIKHKAKTGVFLSVLGFGSGNLQDRTMETLADKGNGNYAYIDSLSEARKVLVEQMSGTLDTIAKDVKIQVEFNPAAVRSYRLIGYENRLLAKEDFNDDTKDAGEIGAGHSVVALYEVVPANLPPGTEPRPAVDSLKYQAPAISAAQLAEAAKSGEMMTVKLRYKAPDSDLSKLIEVPTKDEGKTLTASTDEFKFSAAVAGFGLLLRDSSYQGSLSWETVRRLALDGKGADKLGYRGEFLQLIDKARGLKEVR